MSSLPLINGVLLGLSVAAPFGPVSLLCVQRSLTAGPRYGIISGSAAALAHGTFALVAILAADAVATMLPPWQPVFRLLSGVTLIGLGLRTLLRLPKAADTAASSAGVRLVFLSALALALSNPMTILPYLAVATNSAAAHPGLVQLVLCGVLGVMLGALTWYCCLAFGTAALRAQIGRRTIQGLNILGGGLLLGFGVRSLL